MSYLNTIVQLRNDSGSTITIGALSIDPAEVVDIWDTQNFNSNLPLLNFIQVYENIAVFNEELGNGNLVMIVNSSDIAVVQDAFNQYQELNDGYIQLDESELSLVTLRADTQETKGLNISHINLKDNNQNVHPQYYATDGSNPLTGDLDLDGYSIVNGTVTGVSIDGYNLPDIYEALKNPSGFTDRTTSTISIDNGTRTFTIAPVSGSYEFFIDGVKITKSGPDQIVFPDTEGLHFFWFDKNANLVTSTDEKDFGQAIEGSAATVAAVAWNADDNEVILFGEERHGLMDGRAHIHFHNAFGAQWYSGGELIGIDADDTGFLDSHAQFEVAAVRYADEDIIFDIDDGQPQDLTPIAKIPVYYRFNGGTWRKKTSDNFPLIQSGTAGYVGPNGRLAYNPDVSSLGARFIGSTQNAVEPGSTITLTVPTGTVDGDVMIAMVCHSESEDNTFTTPTGWTLVVDELQTPSGPSIPGTSIYIRVASSEPASYDFVGTDLSGIIGAMLTYRGVDTVTPLDVTTVTDTGSASSPNPPSITTVTDGAMIVAIGFKDDGAETITAISPGYDERENVDTTTGNNGSALAVCDYKQSGSGLEDPGPFTSGPDEWAAITLALRPDTSGVENWQLEEVSEEDFVLVHYWATNDINEPIVGICGQKLYTTIDDATAGAQTELSSLRGLLKILGPEFTPLGTVIWQSSISYTNTVRARPRTTAEGGTYTDFRGNVFKGASSGGGGVSDHGLLSGLDANDHPQYSFNKYDAVVDVGGDGDYTSIAGAFNAGAQSVFVRSGEYFETENIVLPASGILDGEGTVQINFGGDGYSIVVDAGEWEKDGYVTVTNGSTTVGGIGTTFTNLSPGFNIRVGTSLYPVLSITNDTSLELAVPYLGVSASPVVYWAGPSISCNISRIDVTNSSESGLYMRGVTGSTINTMTITNCATNIELIDCTSVAFDAIASYYSSGTGISITECASLAMSSIESVNNAGDGWRVVDSRAVEITKSTSNFNLLDGLDITGSSLSLSVNTFICVGNSGRGFNINGTSQQITLSGCISRNNGSHGVDVDGYDTLVSSCVIVENDGYGVQGGDSAIIVDCHIDSNTDSGIYMMASNNSSVISGNHIVSNQGSGIELVSGSSNSTITGNFIDNNDGYGVFICDGCIGNIITSNKVTNHSLNINNLDSSTIFSVELSGNPEQGDIAYHNGLVWERLSAGTSGQFLQTQGVGANPQWASAGNVTGPITSTDNAIARYDGATGQIIQDSSVIVDDSGNMSGIGNITLSGTVDGRDVSVDGANLDNHIANVNNPHATDIGNIGSGTLAELNAAITDATLDDSGDPRTPLAHASTHEKGGSDVIEISNMDTTNIDTKLVLRPDGYGGVAWSPAPTGGASLSEIWRYEGSDTAPPPTSGRFRLNNSDPALATQLYIHDVSRNGIAFGSLISRLDENDFVYIQDEDDDTRYYLYLVTSKSIDNGTYVTVNIAVEDSGSGPLLNLRDHSFLFLYSGDDVDAVHVTVADEFVNATNGEKILVDSADRMLIEDSTDGYNKAYIETGNIAGALKHQDLSGAGTNTHAQIDAHIANTSNPHSTDIGNIGSGTLAELNAAITDATLDDSGDPRTPTAHASTHEDGGSDEISIAGLSGEAADAQKVTVRKAGTDVGTRPAVNFIEGSNITITTADDAGNGEVDVTITASGGSGDVSGPGTHGDNILPRFDGVNTNAIQTSGITVDDSDNITGAGNFNGVTVESHAARHEDGGADEIDGYQLALNYTPVNYDAPASNVIGEHIASIDNALSSSGGGTSPAMLEPFSYTVTDVTNINVFQNGNVWYTVFIPDFDITVTSMRCHLTQSASGSIYMGIYNSSGTLLADDSTGVSSGSQGFRDGTLDSSLDLTGGTTYYLAVACSGNGSAFSGKTVASSSVAPIRSGNGSSGSNPATGLPSSITISNAQTEAVWMSVLS